MTSQQFNNVFRLAQSSAPLWNVDTKALYGCGLPGFQRVAVTSQCAAAHVRWQCMQLNGQWDSEALAETQRIFRNRVDLLGIEASV